MCGVPTERSADLSDKPRAETKPGRIATYTLSDFKKAWHAAGIEDNDTIVNMGIRGHLIKLPPGEEVIVLGQEGEFVELRFVHRTTHPDVWVHKDSIWMK